MQLHQDSVLRVAKPLYGVPEAGNHWFRTYHTYHTEQLRMEQSTYDPCLLYSTAPFGIVGLQTDDTLFIGNETFTANEEVELKKANFLAKTREQLGPSTPLKFNGGIIRLEGNSISLTQEKQCNNLSTISDKPSSTTSSRGIVRQNLTTKEQYVA